MKKGILILLLLLSQNGKALEELSPTHCPAVFQIKSRGLSSNLARDDNGKWYAGRTHESYGTPYKWTFVIGEILAPTKNKALLEAYEALLTLTYVAGPMKAPSDKWLCLYKNDEGFPSGAMTPPISFEKADEMLK